MAVLPERPTPPPTPLRTSLAARTARRLDGVGSTIFAEMSALALRTGAINLGQGFPDTDGPDWMLAAARQAIADGVNQYPPGRGIAPLREAVVAHSRRHYGLDYDADTEVACVTCLVYVLRERGEWSRAADDDGSGLCGLAHRGSSGSGRRRWRPHRCERCAW